MTNSAAHASMCAHAGRTGATIQIATAIRSTPKNFLTPSIQPPARGNSELALRPTSNNGTLIPAAIANRAPPPIMTSCVCEM